MTQRSHTPGHLVGMFAVAAVGVLTSCTDDGPNTRNTSSEVANGTVDDDNDYPYVAKISGPTNCSGILISPGLILTAGHCMRGGWCMDAANTTVDRTDDDWAIGLGAGPLPGDLQVQRTHTFELVRRGVTFPQPIQTILTEATNNCTKEDPSQDLALIRLDQRVPSSLVTPMHVALNGYPSCIDKLGDGFAGTIVGFGDCVGLNSAAVCDGSPNYPRTFALSGGWVFEEDRPEAPFEGPACLLDGGFCRTDLTGGLYSNYWTLAEYSSPLYKGSLGGDSGGPVVSDVSFPELLPGATAGMIGNHGGKILCGADSRRYLVMELDMYPKPPIALMGNDYAAVNGNNESWLAQNVIAADGNFIGECFAGDPTNPSTVALRDQDADDDLIPDMCDPCPNFYDPVYNEGLSATPDTDGDGVPDRCDNCVAEPNPNMIQNVSGTFVKAQADGDNDGYGDVCDSCPRSDLVDVPALDPSDPVPVQPFSDYTCCTTDADCAPGPPCSIFYPESGTPPPLPKLCFPGDSRGTIIDGLIANGAAWDLCENHCAEPPDFDCDMKGDLCDTCPAKSNPSQDDTDADGVGDVCDNCKGTDTLHSEDLNPECDYFHPPLGDDFCQSLHPESVCLPPHPSADGPSPADVPRCSLTSDTDDDDVGQACDNCPAVKNVASWDGQKNCNLVTEQVEDVPYPYIGDACDRNPCTKFHAAKQVQSPLDESVRGWVAKVDYAPRLLPAWQPADPYYGNAFGMNCATPNSHCTQPLATTGLRFCSCDELGPDGKPDPLECQLDGCPVDSVEYLKSPTNWRKPSLWSTLSTVNNGAGPYMSQPEIANQAMINPVPGDPLNTTTLLPEATVSTSTAYWYTKPDIAAYGAGATQLRGVVWSHATYVTNIYPPGSPSQTPAAAAVLFSPWSNYYRGGVFGPPPSSSATQPPAQANAPYIFICDPLLLWAETADAPTLVRATNGYVGIRTVAGDRSLAGGVTFGAHLALSHSPVQWVPASEPVAALEPGIPGLASLSLDGLNVRSVLQTQGGQLVNLGPSGQPPSSAMARVRFGAALSAKEASLFVVGGSHTTTGALARDVWRYDVPTKAWTQLSLTGARPELVLATIYRAEEGALYVFDERLGQARLLRIDLSTRVSTLLGQWTRTSTWERSYLSNTFDGRLLLVSTSSARNEFIAVAFDPAGNLTQTAGPSFLSFQSRGTVVARPTLTEKGLTLPSADPSIVTRNVFAPMKTLLSNAGANYNLIGRAL